MESTQILGHSEALAAIRRLSVSDSLAHALLITGPDGVGKTTFAQQIAADICCLSPLKSGEQCGECRSCVLARAGTHSDITRVVPPKEETTIAQVRELRYTADLQPNISPHRVIIVERAETLNEQAANAILKVLEDAPPKLILILLAPSVGSVLPTVRSRSMQISLKAVPREEMTGFLQKKGLDKDLSQALAAVSGGAPGRAIRLSQSPELQQLLDDISAWVNRLAEADLSVALAMAEWLKGIAESAKKHIGEEESSSDRQAVAWVLDAVMARMQIILYGESSNADIHPLLQKWGESAVASMIKEANTARWLIMSYAQTDLQLERMLIRFLKQTPPQ